LLEDFLEDYRGIRPGHQLALAVWFAKSYQSQEQKLLLLYDGLPMREIASAELQSLLWRSGAEGPPYVKVHWTSVEFFAKQMQLDPTLVAQFNGTKEVLFFDKHLLREEILQAFRVVTEPPGLMKGWYLSKRVLAMQSIPMVTTPVLSTQRQSRPEVGLVKTGESQDFQHCKGLLHIEVNQRWIPLSVEGLQNYSYFHDFQAGDPGHFLFEGGAWYGILRFEVKTAPEYSAWVLEKVRDDRYPEVYLRAVPAPK